MPGGRSAGGRPGVGLAEGEHADWANDSVEVLGQDEKLTRAIAPGTAPWRKLVANWIHFIQDALEGWLNEGRRFPTEKAKKDAIGRLVQGTLERIKKDPKGWVKEHCDRQR